MPAITGDNSVTVWIQPPPADGSGVREPLRPLPLVWTNRAYYDED